MYFINIVITEPKTDLSFLLSFSFILLSLSNMPPKGIEVGLYKRDAELTTKEEGLRNSMEIAIKFKKNNLIMVCALVWAERNPDKTPYDCATEFLNKGYFFHSFFFY